MIKREELEQQYEALKLILERQDLFEAMVDEVFNTLDQNNSEVVEKHELKEFVDNICSHIQGSVKLEDKYFQFFSELDEENTD